MDTHNQGMRHMPANPDKFEFDDSVAEIFPTMARNAIPQYEQFHMAHARMLRNTMATGMKILDVGASRGEFVTALYRRYGADFMRGVQIDMTDNMPGMLERLRADFGQKHNVRVIDADLRESKWQAKVDTDYDVINCTYVLQFLPQDRQWLVLHELLGRLRVGGYLIIGHKASKTVTSDGSSELYDAAHEEYIYFREQNGYTRAEIEAKTRALKGSMFPMDHGELMHALQMTCAEVQETSRWMMFNTLMARK